MGISSKRGEEVPDDVIEAILSLLPAKSLLRFKSVSKSWYSFISAPSLVNMHSQQAPSILALLPVKSLLRFKCVSMSWYSFISDPSFAKMHSERAPSRTHILTSSPSGLSLIALGYRDESDSSYSSVTGNQVELPGLPPPNPKGVRILGSTSCNGLVALSVGNHSDFFISNPCTGDYKKLPHPSTGFLRTSWPEPEPLTGFGYDPSTDDYKLFVGISWLEDQPSNPAALALGYAKVFSVRRNSWRDIPLPTECSGKLHSCLFPSVSGCFVDGALHWMAPSMIRDGILALDLEREKWDVVAVPEEVRLMTYEQLHGCNVVGVLDGRLCLSFYYHHHDIWVMERLSHSWTKLRFTFGGFGLGTITMVSNPYLCQLITLNHKKDELVKYKFKHNDCDAKRRLFMTSQKFRKCQTNEYKCVRFCGKGFQIQLPCEAVMYSETLYFPPLAMFGSNEEVEENEGRRKRQKQIKRLD